MPIGVLSSYVDMLCLINELFYFVDHYGLVLFNNF